MNNTSCYIIVGHYGSGKTEVAGNLAIAFSQRGAETVIADLDIVNPYFRTRESKEALLEYGIKVFSSNIADSPYEDTPGLAAEIASCFINTSRINIIDAGGDPAGTRVLGRYQKYMPKCYEMWMVVNANRYLTGDAASALTYLRGIEQSSGLKITGIINNTHNCAETTVNDVIRGETLVSELSGTAGLPIIATCYEESLTTEMVGIETLGKKMPIKLLHRPRWMSYA